MGLSLVAVGIAGEGLGASRSGHEARGRRVGVVREGVGSVRGCKQLGEYVGMGLGDRVWKGGWMRLHNRLHG